MQISLNVKYEYYVPCIMHEYLLAAVSASQAFSEPTQICKTELFAKIVNGFQSLTI